MSNHVNKFNYSLNVCLPPRIYEKKQKHTRVCVNSLKKNSDSMREL